MDCGNRAQRINVVHLPRIETAKAHSPEGRALSPPWRQLSRGRAQKPQVAPSRSARVMAVITVDGLGKTYPGGTKALDVLSDPKSIRPHIAVVPQEARPQMLLSAYDHIYYMCLIRGRSRQDARNRTRKVMDDLGLWEHRAKLNAELSGGLRQRVIIAMAMVADPEVFFLDEPTIGLDPLGRRDVWAMLRDMTKRGTTILLTTHYLDEAEMLADHLLIVDKGRTAFLGTVDEAKGDTGIGMRVIVEPAAGNGAEREILEPRSDEEILAIVERGLREKRKVTFKPASLEEAFIKIVGGSIESEDT